MFSKRDYDLIRSSDARNAALVISEDLIRCMTLYNCMDFESVRKELSFLLESHNDTSGRLVSQYIKDRQFVICEEMDIVWAYYDIDDEWGSQRYFFEKASHLKSLRDNLLAFNLYEPYRHLEPFELLDSAFDIMATVEDLDGNSPLSWVAGSPVTSLHRRLKEDSAKLLARLPKKFGCLGYNFTQEHGRICMKDTCGLSLYKDAEFDFSEDGIMINANNIALFDYKRIESHVSLPFREKASVSEIAHGVSEAKRAIQPIDLGKFDPEELIYSVFTNQIKDKKFPFIGDRGNLRQVIDLFNAL